MALKITGLTKVKTLRANFKKEFGLTIRVYDGRSFADDNATLASIRKNDNKGGDLSPKRNMKVGNLEDKIMDLFGIKTQIAGSDDSYLCDNDHTLAKALEVDEKKMVKKEKKATIIENTGEDIMIVNVQMGVKGEYEGDVSVVFDDIFVLEMSDENYNKLQLDAVVEMTKNNEITKNAEIGINQLLGFLAENELFCKEIYQKLYVGAEYVADKFGYPSEQVVVVASITIDGKTIKIYDDEEDFEWLGDFDLEIFEYSNFNQPYEEDGKAKSRFFFDDDYEEYKLFQLPTEV